MGNEQSTEGAAAAQQHVDTVECPWSPFAGSGARPSPREAAGAAVGDRLVVVGGRDAEGEHNDVWSRPVAGGEWTMHEAGGRATRARSGHTVVNAPGVGLVVFGGLSHEKGYLSDVALLAVGPDGGFSWSPVCACGALPAGRDKHSAVVVPAGGGWSMLAYGGFGVQPKDDEEDDEADDEDDEAEEKAGASNGEAAEGGGEEEDDESDDDDDKEEEEEESRGPSVNMAWFDDTYALDLSNWYWSKVPSAAGVPKPAARAAHGSCVLDTTADGASAGVGMLVFGGRAASGRVRRRALFGGAAVLSARWTDDGGHFLRTGTGRLRGFSS